ncbi:unnamed protein product [Ambrosiozyma monospora]|uniref:Unnamed protein product n=1 Tax=Ambrosiozyma monospora TaxID=43982 RepID=A0A9W6YX91_AMBMO|nr:unnamed protein product [Ambrosiozyma monospora]
MPSPGNDPEPISVSISISDPVSDSESHSPPKGYKRNALSRTPTPTPTFSTTNNQQTQQLKPPYINSNHKSAILSSSTSSLSLSNRMLSLSTTSLTSLLPSLYNLGSNTNSSMPTITPTSTLAAGSRTRTSRINQMNEQGSNQSLISQSGQGQQQSSASDELARESDVTVSTNVTPQAEYKGFASYVMSCIFLFIWLSWSVLPDQILNEYLGIYYYPSRWWSLAIPSYVLVTMVYIYIALACYNIEVKTVALDDSRTLVDDTGVVITELDDVEICDSFGSGSGNGNGLGKGNIDDYLFKSTSGIWDLPISEVNRVLYAEDES